MNAILGYYQLAHTHMSEAVSRQVVALKKPLVTHGASVRLHPYTHKAPTLALQKEIQLPKMIGLTSLTQKV